MGRRIPQRASHQYTPEDNDPQRRGRSRRPLEACLLTRGGPRCVALCLRVAPVREVLIRGPYIGARRRSFSRAPRMRPRKERFRDAAPNRNGAYCFERGKIEPIAPFRPSVAERSETYAKPGFRERRPTRLRTNGCDARSDYKVRRSTGHCGSAEYNVAIAHRERLRCSGGAFDARSHHVKSGRRHTQSRDNWYRGGLFLLPAKRRGRWVPLFTGTFHDEAQASRID